MFVITLITHVLAALVGIGSVAFYMAAFFYPEVNRPRDVVWSGLGLVYALVLWFGAAQMSAAILLGQCIAGVLLGVLGYQTLSIRREKTPVYQQTPVVITPEVAGNWAKNKINQLRIAPAEPVPLKLEKRSLSEFSDEGLGAPVDPRRRPVSEYEFVEDGLWREALDNFQDDAQLSLDWTDDRGDLEMEPPSAIADVISVDIPEAVIVDSESDEPETEADDLEEATAPESQDDEETAVAELQIEEAETEAAAQVEDPQTEEFEHDNVSDAVISDESAVIVKTEQEGAVFAEAEADEEEWGDRDWIEEEPLDSESSKKESSGEELPEKKVQAAPQPPLKSTSAPSKLPKEKPSLLAMPVILAGWLKDVAVSFTKPKPSKPVIEIPRREPSIPRQSDISDAVSSPISTVQSPIIQTETPPSVAQSPTTQPSVAQPISQSPVDQSVPADSMWKSDSDSNWDDESEAQEESNWDD